MVPKLLMQFTSHGDHLLTIMMTLDPSTMPTGNASARSAHDVNANKDGANKAEADGGSNGGKIDFEIPTLLPPVSLRHSVIQKNFAFIVAKKGKN